MALIQAIAQVVDILLLVYSYLIIGRAIVSWVSPDPYNPIVSFLYTTTEPILKYARKLIPPIGGALDISPIVVLVVIYFVRILVTQFLYDLARSFA